MYDFMGFLAAIAAAGALLVCGVFGVVAGVGYGFDAPACAKYGQLSGQPTYYSLGTSCLVQRSGEWVKYGVAVGEKQEITIKSK
jgi:hypothetical protein